jgi:LmbE family N-acetylglucosaminyl deacetylase
MKRTFIRTTFALLVLSLFLNASSARQTTLPTQPAEDRIELYQALLDLTNPWTVMCIAAHPDDEDGTSLIVMRRKFGAHTVSLFSTFGEGGQNAIGPELYEELGAIRARETMAAAEVQGSEPHFLGLKDFGYSKSADEAFRVWGHEEALRRMVLEIRKLRPDVIITNHSVTNNDHGHHQATARLELEAFDAAADANRFPEQLKDGVTVWQVQRLFVRAGRSNQAQAETSPVVTIDPNEGDPIRNATFAEEALSALRKHATQGPWPKTVAELAQRFRSSPDGKLPLTRYVLTREAKGAQPLPKDSHNFLDGLRLPENVATQLAAPMIDGQPLTNFANGRNRVLHSLLVADHAFPEAGPKGEERPRFLFMKQRLFHALAVVSGVTVTVNPADRVLVPGRTSDFVISISNAGSEAVKPYLLGFSGTAKGGEANSTSPLLPGKTIVTTRQYKTPSDAVVNLPPAQHLYDGQLFGRHISANAFVKIEDATFMVPVETSIDVAPPVEIADISPSPIVVTPGTPSSSETLGITLTNHTPTTIAGNLKVKTMIMPGLDFPPGPSFSLARGETQRLSMNLGDLIGLYKNGRKEWPFNFPKIWLSIFPSEDGRTLPTSAPQTVLLVSAGARVSPNLRVGYLRGFDFSLPNALNALGVESKELSVDDVKSADLQKYTSIIVDNRVYESTPGLIAVNQKLLDYAKAGGTLIVFYHKSFEWNPDPRRNRPDQLAPYKLILGDERITDETAPITFIEPQHPLLNSPNKIGPEDFANWIQERGLYYPKEWDPQFHALLQSNDPGEAPLKGGLLVADYGRGHYIYTSMVWYRELRAGVPGAYRMLANMISYGR